MTLTELSAMIKQATTIDHNKLDAEALNIAPLYSKWICIMAVESRELRRLQIAHDKRTLERTNYYMGKADDEVYKQEPLNHKVLKQDLPTWLNADDKYNETKSALNDQVIKITMIETFMKELAQRSFNIKNSIEYQKFKAGGF